MKIAVIGGIGSGKSEVMLAFERVGFSVLSADKINGELWQDDGYIDTLKANFPDAVIDGKITRSSLASVVFCDKEKLALLNSIAHPLIVGKIKDCNDEHLAVELPLAIESGILDTFDKVILVDTKTRVRLKRLEGRGVERKRAKEIMSLQVPVKELKKHAHIILTNNGTLEELSTKAISIASALIK